MANIIDCKQMLGVDRPGDASYLRNHELCSSQDGRMDVLCLSLAYVLHFGYTKSKLCRDFDLRPNTLTDISKGIGITKFRERYEEAFIQALNKLRLRAILFNNEELAQRILQAMGELLLVKSGLATDAELVERHKKNKSADETEWREMALRNGFLMDKNKYNYR